MCITLTLFLPHGSRGLRTCFCWIIFSHLSPFTTEGISVITHSLAPSFPRHNYYYFVLIYLYHRGLRSSKIDTVVIV